MTFSISRSFNPLCSVVGQNQVILTHQIIYFSTSSEVSEQASEQTNEQVAQMNERTDKRVAQYLHPDFWLF